MTSGYVSSARSPGAAGWIANVLLDDVDKVLEARGYSFARYADDCNVYVGSARAGQRVMELLRKLYAGLKLRINEVKSSVGSALGRKFLGYALWVAAGKAVKCKVATKPLQNFKARIRQLTRRSGGRSMEQVVEKLRSYVLGWKAYFGLGVHTHKHQKSGESWIDGCATDCARSSLSIGSGLRRSTGSLKHLVRTKMLPDGWRCTVAAGGATAPCYSTMC